MEQKRVSFNVAKAIKEAGYPQDECEELKMRGLPEHIDIPTYFDVWLWLWRKKKIYIDICSEYGKIDVSIWYEDNEYYYECDFTDPEEAIIEAIDYLVTNNLIK